jgi:hypothetical protein
VQTASSDIQGVFYRGRAGCVPTDNAARSAVLNPAKKELWFRLILIFGGLTQTLQYSEIITGLT